ncbi:hypothetical protein XU18_3968 [Perkinsela sp. CCAP 1560/4]|nr:hypothetical protein XU18_3968 [Perkinsela sp. CCAP 1560/4]|eukprot:KNH04910.1 hypothetical protein XU18_3968 [Perkinsela sp. CCAP 1560/4]
MIDTGRARSENHGALRARDWVGGSAPLPARISAWSERGWSMGVRAKTATLVHRRVQDAMQVTPVWRPVWLVRQSRRRTLVRCFVFVGLMPNTRLQCVSRAQQI